MSPESPLVCTPLCLQEEDEEEMCDEDETFGAEPISQVLLEAALNWVLEALGEWPTAPITAVPMYSDAQRVIDGGHPLSPFLGPGGLRKVIETVQKMQQTACHILVRLNEKPSHGHMYLEGSPTGEVRFVNGPVGDMILLGGEAGALLLDTIIMLFFPVNEVAFLSTNGERTCYTCIQLESQLGSLVGALAQYMGVPVYLLVVDNVPAVAPAKPGSSRERNWGEVAAASLQCVHDLLCDVPTLQLVVESTKVHRRARQMGHLLPLFAAATEDGLAESLAERMALYGGEEAYVHTFRLGGGPDGDTTRRMVHTLHPSAKQPTSLIALVSQTTRNVVLRIDEDAGPQSQLQEAMAEKANPELYGERVRLVQATLDKLLSEDPRAHAALMGAYRENTQVFWRRLEKCLGGRVLAQCVREALAVVLASLTLERLYVAVAATAQLKSQGYELEMQQATGAILEGGDQATGLRAVLLRHPDAEPYLDRKLGDLVDRAQELPSFGNSVSGRPSSAARVAVFVYSLLIDIKNGALGGAYVFP